MHSEHVREVPVRVDKLPEHFALAPDLETPQGDLSDDAPRGVRIELQVRARVREDPAEALRHELAQEDVYDVFPRQRPEL